MSSINETKITHFLAGHASEEEANEILQWKNESQENRKTFQEMETAYNVSEIIMNPEKYDANESYLKISSNNINEEHGSFQINLRHVIGYAAAILVTASLTIFTSNYFTPKHPDVNQVVYNSIETSSGAKSLVTLEDGTKIWLNAHSKLIYPNRFVGGQRIVKLEGEGYFEVAKEKTRPFRVETSGLSINVLGTTFNLKSYPEEGLIETTLIEGEIVLNKIIEGQEDQNLLRLKPNQKATFVKKDGLLLTDEIHAANIPVTEIEQRSSEKLVIAEIADLEPVVAWKDDRMVFKNETFESIAVKLGRRYNARFDFIDKEVKQYRFSGVFEEISIDQALKALQFASQFSFEINQDVITIKK
jgi:ferric-dicitrate binding protein FerR (iron transport regulator)